MSEDVTTAIYIFNILITYIFINLSQLFIYLIYLSYKFIYLLFAAVRHPPSAVLPFTESRIFVGNGCAVQLNVVYVGLESERF